MWAYLQQAALQGDPSAMAALAEVAPDSPIVKVVQKMQEQAQMGAPGQMGGGEVTPNPAQQVEAGANALQAGSVRDLATLLGPIAQRMGNGMAA